MDMIIRYRVQSTDISKDQRQALQTISLPSLITLFNTIHPKFASEDYITEAELWRDLFFDLHQITNRFINGFCQRSFIICCSDKKSDRKLSDSNVLSIRFNDVLISEQGDLVNLLKASIETFQKRVLSEFNEEEISYQEDNDEERLSRLRTCSKSIYNSLTMIKLSVP